MHRTCGLVKVTLLVVTFLISPFAMAQARHVIAVLPFENKVQGYGEASAAMGEGMSEMLTTALLKSGSFVVVERERIQDIVKEQEVGMSGLVNPETAVKAGGLAGAQFFIKGAVTEFNPAAGGGGLSIGWDLGRVATKSRKAYLAIDVRIIDNATGQIFASHSASATASSSGASASTRFGDFSDMFDLGISGFSSTAVGQAIRKAMEDVLVFIEQEADDIPWEGAVVKSDGKKVYINRGKSANVKKGETLHVYAKGEPLIDPDTGFNLGNDEEYLCSVKIISVKPNFSISKFSTDCQDQDINRGDVLRYE